MKQTALTVTFWLAVSASAYASGTHTGGHDDELAVGKPGTASEVDRVIKITMTETDDGKMLFKPSKIVAKKGETIRLSLTNTGETDHEFVLDSPQEIEKHKAVMEKFPEMEHDDPNALRLAPGKKGEIIWTFTTSGQFQFACMIPGHMESGMHGPIEVK